MYRDERKIYVVKWLQIVLKVAFIALLFVDGMFQITSHHEAYYDRSSKSDESTYSFVDASLGNYEEQEDSEKRWRMETDQYFYKNIGSDSGRYLSWLGGGSFRNDYCVIAFYFLIPLLAVDLVFSIIQMRNLRIHKWQLALPISTFVLFMSMGLAIFRYDETIRHSCDMVWNNPQVTTVPGMDSPEASTMFSEYYADIHGEILFYIAAAVSLIVLMIDVAIIISQARKQKRMKLQQDPLYGRMY